MSINYNSWHLGMKTPGLTLEVHFYLFPQPESHRLVEFFSHAKVEKKKYFLVRFFSFVLPVRKHYEIPWPQPQIKVFTYKLYCYSKIRHHHVTITVKPRNNGCQGTNQFHLLLADCWYCQYRKKEKEIIWRDHSLVFVIDEFPLLLGPI